MQRKSKWPGLLAFAWLGTSAALAAGEPTAVPVTGPGVTGQVVRFANMPSKHVAPRNVDVWLPPGYDSNGSRRYPVLYMHDGQNVFDPATSYGGVDWGIDETMTRLIDERLVRPAIIVAIWNSPKRFLEYMPRRPVREGVKYNVPGIPDVTSADVISDQYLEFMVGELKPFIDAQFRTLSGHADTFVMGSSMGGLISAYALTAYPAVFGGAGCVSTHWPAGDGIAVDDFGMHLPDPKTHRFYFDFGTATLDAGYEPYQQRVDEMLRAGGYTEGLNWITRKFPGAEHSERAWRLRVDQPLRFLLGREDQP
jgi:predicted alpha/beta superfamily hydrolase